MKQRKPRQPKCNCDEDRKINAHRGNMPVILWTCPVHGNLFEERPAGIVLTKWQEKVLALITEGKLQGSILTADDISKITNRTRVASERAMGELQQLNYI